MNSLSATFASLRGGSLRLAAGRTAVRTGQATPETSEAASVTLSREALARLAGKEQVAASLAQMDEATALQRAGHDSGRRIQEAKEKLRQLLIRLQRALLMGDKRAVAAIAKEAAGLAKEVAAAVKEAAGDARALQAAAAEAAGSEEREPSGTTAEPGRGELALQDPHGLDGGLDRGLLREAERAMLLVRTALAMARSALGGRRPSGEAKPGERSREEVFRKEMDAAEDETREAAEDIQAAVRSVL